MSGMVAIGSERPRVETLHSAHEKAAALVVSMVFQEQLPLRGPRTSM